MVSAALPPNFGLFANPELEIRGNQTIRPINANSSTRNAHAAYREAVNKLKSIKANIESIRAGESIA